MTKVIKGEFEKIKDVKVEDISLTYDTPLEVFNNEVSRLSGMDDDLFTYEVEVSNIPYDSKMDNESEHEVDDDMGYDPSDVAFTEWLGSKNFNYKIMDHYTMNALWIYWIRGYDEIELTDDESSDDMNEVAGVFRIDTNLFNFETPMCKTFKEFNYRLQVDPDLLTKDIEGFKTYEDCKNDWIYEWNKDVPWVDEKPWTNVEVWTNQHQSNILTSLSTIRLDVRNGQHVVGWMMDTVMEETYSELTLLETSSIMSITNGYQSALDLGRPFLSTARAKINVYKRKITLRVGEESLFSQLRRNQGDDLIPTIEEGEVIEEFRTRDDELDTKIDDYPSYCDSDKKIHIDLLEDMDAYRDKGMGDVIFGEPFLRKIGIKTKRLEGIITLYQKSDEGEGKQLVSQSCGTAITMCTEGMRVSGKNKLRKISISVNDIGKQFVDMDPILEEGTYFLDEVVTNEGGLYFLKFKGKEGMNYVQENKPWITTSMCEKSYGRASFARVLIEVGADKGFVDEKPVNVSNMGNIGNEWQTVSNRRYGRNDGMGNGFNGQRNGYGEGTSRGGFVER
ncbi:hypothetical protein Tco_0092459, partial [Tanacetum coccineum]